MRSAEYPMQDSLDIIVCVVPECYLRATVLVGSACEKVQPGISPRLFDGFARRFSLGCDIAVLNATRQLQALGQFANELLISGSVIAQSVIQMRHGQSPISPV